MIATAGENYSVQANLMDKATVWPAMAMAFETARGDLADRMHLAHPARAEWRQDLVGAEPGTAGKAH